MITDGLSKSSLVPPLSWHQCSAEVVQPEQQTSPVHRGSAVQITVGLAQASFPREMEANCCFPVDVSECFQPSQVFAPHSDLKRDSLNSS